MKINKFLKEYNCSKEIKIIGREFYSKGKLVEVIGFYRTGRTLQLLLIEYDKQSLEKESEIEQQPYYDRVITNRIMESERNYYCAVSENIESVEIDNIVFNVSEAGITRTSLSDYKNTLMFTQFFENGWKPKSIGKKEIDDCFLCSIMFDDKFTKIPNFDENSSITFSFSDDMKKRLVEQEIVLDTTKEYKDKIYFTDKGTGENHWIFINKVYVYDLYKETMEKLNDPKYYGSIDPEQLYEIKKQTMKNILETCPQEKGLICVEYESDLDMQVNFKSKEWLESEVVHKNSSTMFMARPDKKYGKNGNRLRADIVDQPVDMDTKILEAEIFCVYKQIKTEDIKI